MDASRDINMGTIWDKKCVASFGGDGYCGVLFGKFGVRIKFGCHGPNRSHQGVTHNALLGVA